MANETGASISLLEVLKGLDDEGIKVIITNFEQLRICKTFLNGNRDIAKDVARTFVKQGYCISYPSEPDKLVTELMEMKKVKRTTAEKVVRYFEKVFTDPAECRVICIYVVARVVYKTKAKEALKALDIKFDTFKKTVEGVYYSNEDFKDTMDYESFEAFDNLLLRYKKSH